MSTWWREWATSLGLSAELQDRGELCLNEAVANIIRHGRRARAVAITLEWDAEAVLMIVADDGDPFDPVTSPVADLPRTLDEARPGGLGIHILRADADAVAYQRDGDWNILTLTCTRAPLSG